MFLLKGKYHIFKKQFFVIFITSSWLKIKIAKNKIYKLPKEICR